MYIFVSLIPWQDMSKTATLLKFTISKQNNDQFCKNPLKEVFLSCFKKVSDNHLQYTLFAEYSAKYSKPEKHCF